jgi:hypothetical protein
MRRLGVQQTGYGDYSHAKAISANAVPLIFKLSPHKKRGLIPAPQQPETPPAPQPQRTDYK